jgi:uncharacterized small protein (DUF1192 family)
LAVLGGINTPRRVRQATLFGGDMDTDDLEPVAKKPDAKNLEIMSIEALGEYIAELEGEIERVHAEIALKEKARDGAESVFRK